MTEPELKEVLSEHLLSVNKPTTVFRAFNEPDFPKRLFEELGREKAYDVLLNIYHGLTIEHHELCQVERAIVLEVRSWDREAISEQLKKLRGCFLESDLKTPRY